MSRCAIKTTRPDHYIVVGFDPPLQCWFLQVYDKKVEQSNDGVMPCGRCGRLLDSPTGDVCDCEECVVWEPNVRSNGDMLDLMQTHGVDLTDSYTKAVYDCIAMDLDPERVQRSN